MMKLKEKMTPAELAEVLGLARQTVNRWAREQKWRTEAIPGVKGGRARLIVIDRPVIDFLTNIPAFRHLNEEYQLAEQPSGYFINEADAVWRQIADTLQLMTAAEQTHLRDLLARDGISGFLARLGISPATKQRRKKRQD